MRLRAFKVNWTDLGIIVGALLVIGVAGAVFILNPLLDRLVAEGILNEMLDKETSKGLHLSAQYAPFQREGLWGIATSSLQGEQGERTMKRLKAEQISGSFNPWGVFLRRWEVDDIHLASGMMELQKVNTTPEELKQRLADEAAKRARRPWYSIFLPDQVYLAHTICDSADALWQINGKPAGLFRTSLVITPNERDFEYDAQGGELRMEPMPPLQLLHLHMLIRKPQLYLNEMVLAENAGLPDQNIRITGRAGLQFDRSIQATVEATQLNIKPWLPVKLQTQIKGILDCHLDYQSTGTGLETSSGQGTVHLEKGELHKLTPFVAYCKLTDSPDPGTLPLTICQSEIKAEKGVVTLDHFQIESPGAFHLEGSVVVGVDKSLSGHVWVGLAPVYLKWLPSAQRTIFTERRGDFATAKVNVFGTLQHPQEDLSPRILAEVRRHPFIALKLLFRAASGGWLEWDK